MRLSCICFIIFLLLACTSVPTRPQWDVTIDDAYSVFCWMFDEDMFEEGQRNDVVTVWFATFSHHEAAQYVVQIDERSFQVPCWKCDIVGNWEENGSKYEWHKEIRAIVLTWLHDDPSNPRNWTFKKVDW